jgi:hypothetical protein
MVSDEEDAPDETPPVLEEAAPEEPLDLNMVPTQSGMLSFRLAVENGPFLLEERMWFAAAHADLERDRMRAADIIGAQARLGTQDGGKLGLYKR